KSEYKLGPLYYSNTMKNDIYLGHPPRLMWIDGSNIYLNTGSDYIKLKICKLSKSEAYMKENKLLLKIKYPDVYSRESVFDEEKNKFCNKIITEHETYDIVKISDNYKTTKISKALPYNEQVIVCKGKMLKIIKKGNLYSVLPFNL